MRRVLVVRAFVAVIAVLVGSAVVWAACTALNYPASARVDTINIKAASGTPSDTVSAIGTARGRWNTNSCNTPHRFTGCPTCPVIAPTFPKFLAGSGGFEVKEVAWSDFSNKCKTVASQHSPPAPYLCACTDRINDTSGTIYVNKDEVRGASCGGLENSLTHELGHILGLKDSSCAGYVMKDPLPAATPTTGECSLVRANWTTASEEEGQEGQGIDPLVLDIEGNGIHTSAPHADGYVFFDVDGDGQTDSTAWLNWYSDDVFLWIDLNGNRMVDGGHEFLGPASLTPWGDSTGAAHGFDALALYDTLEFGGNDDGMIDHRDRIWSHVMTWHDQNGDGISQRSEISNLPAFRIVRIDLAYAAVNQRDGSLNTVEAIGRYWVRGIGGGLRERRIAAIGLRAGE